MNTAYYLKLNQMPQLKSQYIMLVIKSVALQSKKSYINMDDKIITYIEYNYYIYRTDHTFNIISGHPGRTSMSTTQSKAN